MIKINGGAFRGYEIMYPDVLNVKRPDIVVVLTDAIQTISEQIRKNYGTDIRIENKKYFYKECMVESV